MTTTRPAVHWLQRRIGLKPSARHDPFLSLRIMFEVRRRDSSIRVRWSHPERTDLWVRSRFMGRAEARRIYRDLLATGDYVKED